VRLGSPAGRMGVGKKELRIARVCVCYRPRRRGARDAGVSGLVASGWSDALMRARGTGWLKVARRKLASKRGSDTSRQWLSVALEAAFGGLAWACNRYLAVGV